MHQCPYPTCTSQVEYGIFACRTHWQSLPLEIRRRIQSAWRRWRAGYAAGPTAHRDAASAAAHFWDAQLQEVGRG